MADYDDLRRRMVDCQLRPGDVTRRDILDVFGRVPRERFVPAGLRSLSYSDDDLLISSSPPRYLVSAIWLARLVQLSEISSDSIVLDVGCGTGYSTAILSRLSDSVVALESDSSLSAFATSALQELDYDNCVVLNEPLDSGYAKEGPYDVIMVCGSVDSVPAAVTDQLKDGGRLVTVEGSGNSGVAVVYFRSGAHIARRESFNCAVPPLPCFTRLPEFEF